MNYIENIQNEIINGLNNGDNKNKYTLLRIEDYDFICRIIANHIIASSLDTQYVKDAEEYLKQCE